MLPIPMFSSGSGPVPIAPAQAPFKFTVNTNNTGTGTTPNNQFTIPLRSGYTYSVSIDWGDGTTQSGVPVGTTIPHTYSSVGTYQVQVSGTFDGIYFNNTGDARKLISIDSWGAIVWKTMAAAFSGCFNMSANFTDTPNLLNVTNTDNMFAGCTLFNSDISGWGVSTITSMDNMFAKCSAFNSPLNSWNVGNVTIMSGMFSECTIFNQSLSTWNVANVTTMASMFTQCSAFNQNINVWNVGNVASIQSMFSLCPAFNQPLNSWNVGNVTNAFNFMTGKTNSDYSATNLDGIYNGWSALTLKPTVTISFGTIKYTAASSAGRLILTSSPNSWTITDGGI